MGESQKVLWDEGMLLTPQHFQQWDRYYETLLRQRVRTLCPFDWGLCDLQVDPEALNGGELSVASCSGVMPDGLHFDAPRRDRLPAARRFKELFDPGTEALGVHLCVPVLRTGGLACGEPDDTEGLPRPYVRGVVSVQDEVRTGSERELVTAAANLALLFDGESLEDYQSMKVAEVVRTATGGYALGKSFVPACQFLSVSPFLMQFTRRIVEMLSSKSEELAGQQRKSGGMAEAAGFWLLHTVNSHLPALLHYYHRERVHPELLFLELARLAAELCTFAGQRRPRELPRYDHDDLGGTFGQLEAIMSELLGTVVPNRCVPIPLERESESMFAGQIRDDALLRDAQFYLAVSADAPETKIVNEIPIKSKFSSRDKVPQLIMMALPGIVLRHVPSPPAEIPVQPGRTYFQVERVGEHWAAIEATGSVAIHIPPEFPQLRLELMAVKE